MSFRNSSTIKGTDTAHRNTNPLRSAQGQACPLSASCTTVRAQRTDGV